MTNSVTPRSFLCLLLILSALLSSKPIHAQNERLARKRSKPFSTGATDDVIRFIDQQIEQGWQDNEVSPSDIADDAEWLRRVSLDIVGHIPASEDVEAFLADRDKSRRSKAIDRLLDDPDYVGNWTTIWTNLLIGRQTPRRVNRDALQDFLREAFGENRSWNDVVFDLVSAEGRFDENGAVNYLLAQMTMNDDAVQATAKTTRLFMGIQVQCTQCHNHPFNDWKQDQFWQFNSFFRQARRIDHRKPDSKTGRMVDDYSELVSREFSGPVYFEKRNGLMQVAFPRFFDQDVDPGVETDRRRELARLMTEGERPFIATAMVNRMWGHFFGYGFTQPVDDMGPHNSPTHPELLDRLGDEFVKSRYDLKQLIRWICNSKTYHLTSRFGRRNQIDDPSAGESPLFSHMYVKSLEPEQLYESLIVATNVNASSRTNLEQIEKQRRQWLRRFVIALDTDENDEATTFDGTIPQALMMMNGGLIAEAVSGQPGSFLHQVLSREESDKRKIRRLYISALGRKPSRKEMTVSNNFVKSNSDHLAGYQDLFWVLLNSNEFIFNH